MNGESGFGCQHSKAVSQPLGQTGSVTHLPFWANGRAFNLGRKTLFFK